MQKNRSRRVPLRGQRGRTIPPDFPFKAVTATLNAVQVATDGSPALAGHIKRQRVAGQAGRQFLLIVVMAPDCAAVWIKSRRKSTRLSKARAGGIIAALPLPSCVHCDHQKPARRFPACMQAGSQTFVIRPGNGSRRQARIVPCRSAVSIVVAAQPVVGFVLHAIGRCRNTAAHALPRSVYGLDAGLPRRSAAGGGIVTHAQALPGGLDW